MDVYRTDRIRNVVLLGHGGSGKTTLAEAMAYLAGMTSRLGRVEDGNTVSDFDKEEIKRKFSISTSVIPVPWDKVKINILDTPGYFDFVGEVEEAVSAAGMGSRYGGLKQIDPVDEDGHIIIDFSIYDADRVYRKACHLL